MAAFCKKQRLCRSVACPRIEVVNGQKKKKNWFWHLSFFFFFFLQSTSQKICHILSTAGNALNEDSCNVMLNSCFVCMGLFSGHGSFSNNKKLNSLVGHLTHSSILVPYHGW
jgi:hypothetical protein